MAFTAKHLVALLVTLAMVLNTALALACNGCVDLDELNFDKTIRRFPYAIVKFDIAFPYGDKHDAFAEFAKAAHKSTDDLLVATVGIKDYGENENKQLGQRYKVNEKNFPGIFLFKGDSKHYEQMPAHLDITVNNLKKFVSENTDLYIGRDGCLKEFNELVKNFANLDDEAQKQLIIIAEEMGAKLTKDTDQTSAKVYVTFMRKINAHGYAYVEEETKRLLRLRAGKVTDAKKVELQNKLNVLEAFRVTKLKKTEQANEEL